MNKLKHILFLTVCLYFVSNTFAQDAFPYQKGKVKHRISFGPVISFYINHPYMTMDTKRKLGFNVAYKAELLLGRKTNLMLGLEYMSQGLTFKGYYKAPNYTYLFDKTFAYTHELRYNEVQLPLGLKLAFNNEKEHGATPYLFGGVGAKYIFGSYVVITNDSTNTTPYDSKSSIGYEHERIAKGMNGFYFAGLGLQKNYRDSGRAIFLEFTYRYGFSRIHYTGYENSNNLNIKEMNLAITLGFRI